MAVEIAFHGYQFRDIARQRLDLLVPGRGYHDSLVKAFKEMTGYDVNRFEVDWPDDFIVVMYRIFVEDEIRAVEFKLKWL